MNTFVRHPQFSMLALSVSMLLMTSSVFAQSSCPTANWASKKLPTFSKKNAHVPVAAPQSDCEFHQTTYESFVWATTMINGAPRFLGLKTPDQLLTPLAKHKVGNGMIQLNLASRNHAPKSGKSEGAGAIVEADGNMLVGPNGFPVYASVHMNDSYFNTAKKNLIINGGYQKNTGNFNVGAAVFKATWLRLGNGISAPTGSYVTKAYVPVLAESGGVVKPDGDKTVLVDVALLGLHVVELTKEHPEFLWGTFEHNLNAPMLPDGTFSAQGSSPNNYTLYKAGTLYGQSNMPNQNPATSALSFDATAQTFAPIVNAVQNNATGGDASGNIPLINAAGQAYLNSQKSLFANYVMIGTVWFEKNTYVLPGGLALNQNNGVGSVNLANSTAETFDQMPQSSFAYKNCFACHNATSYSFQTPALSKRLIATSHVLSQGAATYAVPNQVTLPSASASASTPSAVSANSQAGVTKK